MSSASTLEERPIQRRTAQGYRRTGSFDLRALWTLYTLTLRQHLNGRRWMICAVLFLLPAALVLLLRGSHARFPAMGMEFQFIYMFIPQGLLPLLALLYSSGLVQDEQEEQTITYLLIRPISKWALYIVKLLATLTTTATLTFLFTSLTFVAIYFHAASAPVDVMHRCLITASIHALAVSAYCCLFGMISILTKRTLIVGILYIAIFEGLLANLPLSIRSLTVIFYARMIAYRTLSFAVPFPGRTIDFAAEGWQLDVANDPQLLEYPQRMTCILILLAGSLAFTIIAAILCSQKEFHVKTPEKN
ncbi:MAG TPA: ABC transporter permease [Humisphaera sp.]|jgi:ABC-2 type transport system permease protein|nr:ABC transporter permease [Humisphaera sp.]